MLSFSYTWEGEIYVHCTMLIFQKIPAVIKTCLCTKIHCILSGEKRFVASDHMDFLSDPPPQKKKTKTKKTERIICHDNVMSYGAGYLSHNFCSIVRGRLAVLLPNDFVAIYYCKITVDLNLPEFPCINSHQSVTRNLHQMHLTVLAAKRWDLQ